MSPKNPDKVSAVFLGARLRELRQARGWTQVYLAQQLECSDKLIWRWEENKSLPNVTFFLGLDRLFGVSFEDWFTWPGKNDQVAPPTESSTDR